MPIPKTIPIGTRVMRLTEGGPFGHAGELGTVVKPERKYNMYDTTPVRWDETRKHEVLYVNTRALQIVDTYTDSLRARAKQHWISGHYNEAI